MAERSGRLEQQLVGRRIDAFLEEFEKAGEQLPGEGAHRQAYGKWKATMQAIDALLAESNAPAASKGWLVHSSPAHQTTVGALRAGGKLEIRYSFTLKEGLEGLCKLMADPNGYRELLPFCVESRELGGEGPLEKQVLLRYKPPFLTERLMLLRLMAVDRLDHNASIVVYGLGPTPQEVVGTGNARGEWAKLRSFVAEVKVGVADYRVTTHASFDDSLGALPDFLIKKLLQLSSAIVIGNLQSLAKQGGPTKGGPKGNEELMRCIEQRLRLKYPGRL